MNFRKFLKTDFFCVSAILLVACVNVFVRPYFGDPVTTGDTRDYIATAAMMRGEATEMEDARRMLKPLPIWTIVFLAETTGMDLYEAMMAQAIFFYLALAVIIYYFLKLLFGDPALSLLGGVLYISAYPLMKNGIGFLTETGAHFFYVAAVLFIYLFYKNPDYRNYFSAILLISAGLLWKEYIAVAGLLLFFVIVFHDKLNTRGKIGRIAIYAIVSLLASIPWQIYVYYHYHFSYIDWAMLGAVVPFQWSRIYYTAKSIFGVFLLTWVFVALGAIAWPKFDRKKKYFLGLLAISTLLMLLWSGTDSRLFFVIALPGIALATAGIGYLRDRGYGKSFYVLFFLALSANYYWLFYSEHFRSILNRF